MTSRAQSETKLNDYSRALHAALQCAAQVQPMTVLHLQVSGVRIHLRIASPSLTQAMWPALAHLALAKDAIGAATLTFDLWDSASTGLPPPPPPFVADDYRRYGQRAVAYAGPLALMHAPTTGMIFAYDRAKRHGYFWCRDAAELSIYERAAPVQTLFHWALREYGWQVVHAAAVGTAAGGVLLVGNTGTGKSTTALALLEQSNDSTSALRYLSDDKCLVRLTPNAEAFALFNSAKLKADMLARFPGFCALIQGSDDDYKAGKSLAFLHPTYESRMIQRFPVRALVTPRIAHLDQPRLTPVRGPEVFRVLGPSTVIWLPGAEADNYRFTAELTRRLPCYQLDLALEPARNSEAIRELLASQPAMVYSG